jgi:hypothetical protein
MFRWGREAFVGHDHGSRVDNEHYVAGPDKWFAARR